VVSAYDLVIPAEAGMTKEGQRRLQRQSRWTLA
jgi:hypothetical protein